MGLMERRNHYEVQIPVTSNLKQDQLTGDVAIPPNPRGIIVFAHGSASSRKSRRNLWVAAKLQQAGFATLLFDLLTETEGLDDAVTARHRFDIDLLSTRLITSIEWLTAWTTTSVPTLADAKIGLFGASTGAAAALIAAASLAEQVTAVVSRGGRPDLAGAHLAYVKAPTLLIVGARDPNVLQLNKEALTHLRGTTYKLSIVPNATHLFEEPGTLDEVADMATEWFSEWLTPSKAEKTPKAAHHPRDRLNDKTTIRQ